ncbi:MAG: caspase family protein, partial [Saprospiraceae bacterium]|nr:caspase family protein [Saprospiraceae bacterium]
MIQRIAFADIQSVYLYKSPSDIKMQDKRGIGSPSEPNEDTPQGKSWFLGIGINKYEHLPDLNNAVKDIQDIVQVLQYRYSLESEHTSVLLNEEANLRNIIASLDDLMGKVAAEDKLLIYYSGHGKMLDIGENQKGFWIPADGKKDDHSQYIPNSRILEYIEDTRALHALLISDSCFSGTLLDEGEFRDHAAMEELEQRKSRWAICSGREDEQVYDGKPGTNSPFAESILYILRSNNSPKLNVAKFADEVMKLTRANYDQLPDGSPLFRVGHKGGQYVFSLRSQEVHQEKASTPVGQESVISQIEPHVKTVRDLKSIEPSPLAVTHNFPVGV